MKKKDDSSCRKRSFNTKAEANLRLQEILKISTEKVKPKRSYKCKSCGMYHLTSFSQQKYVVMVVEGGFETKRIEDIAKSWIKKKGWDKDKSKKYDRRDNNS